MANSEINDNSEVSVNSGKRFVFEAFTPSENTASKVPEIATPVIGSFKGVFAKLNTMSRNKRFYSADFWREVISSRQVRDDLRNGVMIGIFEHPEVQGMYDPYGRPTASHPVNGAFVTKELWIEGDNLMGRSYILNTPIGKLLSTYFLAKDDNGQPLTQLYISVRGESKGLHLDSNGVDRMNARDYYLRAFDIVLNPGFLDAKVSMDTIRESYNRRHDDEWVSAVESLNDAASYCRSVYRERDRYIRKLGLQSSIRY